MDQTARSRKIRREPQKTFLPDTPKARESASEKTQPERAPLFPGQALAQIPQGIFKADILKSGLGMLIAENATTGTTGKRQKNREKPEPFLQRFGVGKTMPQNFCHIGQKEKKTSC